VAVQNGCDHACTFCIIPAGRGPSRSRSVADVVAEVRAHAEAGVGEVVLTAVDLTGWNREDQRLGDLVAAILREVPALPRLRLSSMDGVEIDPLLREIIASEARVMPHLHLSLQHGADLILKRMKRRHLRADAVDLVVI
jgi:threonylcarbamoyladenosine tRNA methylthiotransferase MtaB